ncbi:MAG TPA: hypothetical protein VGO47_11080, partial [Chlamydiales bacterium]|nr:hypothetical protein [Chlamydiales bacterium]
NANYLFETGPKLIDAVRLTDNVKVVLKRVDTATEEIPIGLYFSREDLRNDPRNHCVTILDVILFPDTDQEAFIVMPFLRNFDTPQFEFKCEYVDAARQFLEVISFS